MSPLRGFTVHLKVEQTLEKPAFTQFREFLPSGIRSRGDQIFLQAGTGFGLAQPSATGRLICAQSADPSALLASFDLINPKHLVNGYAG